MNDSAALNLVLYFPLLAAILLAFFPREQHTWIRNGAITAAALNFLFSLSLLAAFNPERNHEFQLGTQADWIREFGIQYKIGVDGISLMLVLMTTLLTAVAALSSWDAIRERVKEYYVFLLLLETGMLGVFVSLDLVLFYVFWEAMLIPMYFLIGVWGGPRRIYATFKFVLYTLVGSLLMLVAIVWIYSISAQAGPGTFDLEALTGPSSPLATSPALPPMPAAVKDWFTNPRFWLFMAFALAFAIKVPMWPFHTWLPDAHVEAPTAGSVILAGVLLKMGTYGFLRFCIPLFPDVALHLAPTFLVLAIIGIIYGALMAYVQQDVKRLVAYSSVSHLGFCVLGLFAFTREGVAGSVLQMLNHGLSTGALFLLVGMIYERRHTRDIAKFGGLWKVIPIFAAFFLITTLSSIGLPGLNGFVGEFYILAGTWGSPHLPSFSYPWAAALGATGVILGAIYMLWMYQRVMQGPLDNRENQRLKDLNLREVVTLAPLVLLMFWIGIQPVSVFRYFDKAVEERIVIPMQEAHARRGAPAVPSAMPGGGIPGLPPNFTIPPPGGPGGAPRPGTAPRAGTGTPR